MKDRHY